MTVLHQPLQPLMHMFHHEHPPSPPHSSPPPQPPPPITTTPTPPRQASTSSSTGVSTSPSRPPSASPTRPRQPSSPSLSTTPPSTTTTASPVTPASPRRVTPPRAKTGAAAQPLPAPIGIPARKRAHTASSCRPSILSSSPTSTPFSLPEDAGFRLPSPPTSSVIYEERPQQQRSGTPKVPPPRGAKLAPTRSRSTPPVGMASATSKPTSSNSASSSPKAQPKAPSRRQSSDDDFADLLATTMQLATSSCAADALMTGDVSMLTRPAPKRRSSSSTSRKGWTRKLFGGESVLGPLDPNRVAASTVPEPVKAVVFGAETETGIEVCRSMLKARHYNLTALVVDIDTPVTAELRAAGCPVIQVDMDDPATYERRLAGAKAVYLSTNALTLHAILQHQPEPMRTEIARRADKNQLTKAVEACVRAKVGHLVFRVNACGHEVIENMLGKSDIEAKGGKSISSAELDRVSLPHTVLHTSVPFRRVNQWLVDRKDGSVVLDVPVPDDTDIPWFAIEQTGEYVLAALRNPSKWLGADMHAITDVMTPASLAARLSKVTRRRVVTPMVTRAEFDSLETHERLACRWDAWAQIVRHEYDFDASARPTKADVPDQWCFDAWLEHDRELSARFKK